MHWMLVGINFQAKEVYVVDSFNKGGSRGPKLPLRFFIKYVPNSPPLIELLQHTIQMLQWEHRARKNNDLSSQWATKVILADVPQHRNTVNCGIYAIWFAKQLASGNTDFSSWKYYQAGLDERNNAEQLLHLGLPPNNPEVAEPYAGAAEHREIFEAIYPTLPSTNLARRVSLENCWKITITSQPSQVGMCMVFYDVIQDVHYPAFIPFPRWRTLVDSEIQGGWWCRRVKEGVSQGLNSRVTPRGAHWASNRMDTGNLLRHVDLLRRTLGL
ncbi:hypothetical protein B0H11DRAFT_1923045 [Mycena galericulata]|nr:hypothetical protein B0H11DRAFT_1923045 [Mycena galericulata]